MYVSTDRCTADLFLTKPSVNTGGYFLLYNIHNVYNLYKMSLFKQMCSFYIRLMALIKVVVTFDN